MMSPLGSAIRPLLLALILINPLAAAQVGGPAAPLLEEVDETTGSLPLPETPDLPLRNVFLETFEDASTLAGRGWTEERVARGPIWRLVDKDALAGTGRVNRDEVAHSGAKAASTVTDVGAYPARAESRLVSPVIDIRFVAGASQPLDDSAPSEVRDLREELRRRYDFEAEDQGQLRPLSPLLTAPPSQIESITLLPPPLTPNCAGLRQIPQSSPSEIPNDLQTRACFKHPLAVPNPLTPRVGEGLVKATFWHLYNFTRRDGSWLDVRYERDDGAWSSWEQVKGDLLLQPALLAESKGSRNYLFRSINGPGQARCATNPFAIFSGLQSVQIGTADPVECVGFVRDWSALSFVPDNTAAPVGESGSQGGAYSGYVKDNTVPAWVSRSLFFDFWDGQRDGFVESLFILDAYIGKRIQLGFHAYGENPSVVDETGWFVDDVRVDALLKPYEGGIDEVLVPTDRAEGERLPEGLELHPRARIRNFGSETLRNVTVNFTIAGPGIAFQSGTNVAELASLASADVSSPEGWVTQAGNNLTLNVTVGILPQVNGTPSLQADAAPPSDAVESNNHASLRFHVGSVRDVRATFAIPEDSVQTDLDESKTITVELENRGNVPQAVVLNLTIQRLDEHLQPVAGTVRWREEKAVPAIPFGRALNSLGSDANRANASWTWTRLPQEPPGVYAFRVRVRTLEGASLSEVTEALFVRSTPVDYLSENFTAAAPGSAFAPNSIRALPGQLGLGWTDYGFRVQCKSGDCTVQGDRYRLLTLPPEPVSQPFYWLGTGSDDRIPELDQGAAAGATDRVGNRNLLDHYFLAAPFRITPGASQLRFWHRPSLNWTEPLSRADELASRGFVHVVLGELPPGIHATTAPPGTAPLQAFLGQLPAAAGDLPGSCTDPQASACLITVAAYNTTHDWKEEVLDLSRFADPDRNVTILFHLESTAARLFNETPIGESQTFCAQFTGADPRSIRCTLEATLLVPWYLDDIRVTAPGVSFLDNAGDPPDNGNWTAWNKDARVSASTGLTLIPPAVTVLGSLPSALSGASAVWDGQHAYLFGGVNATGYSRAIFRVDPSTGAAVQVADLPSGRAWTSAVWNGTNATIFGGYDGTNHLAQIVQFQPPNKVSTLAITLPTPRSGTSAVLNGTEALVFGGWDGASVLDEVVGVRLITPALHTVLPPVQVIGHLGNNRANTSAVIHGTTAYIIGGWDGTSVLNTVATFNPVTAATGTLADFLPSRLTNTSAAVVGATAYIFGGWTGSSYTDRIAVLNLSTETFRPIGQAPSRLPSGRMNTTAVAAGNFTLVLGGHNGTHLAEIVKYDPILERIPPTSVSREAAPLTQGWERRSAQFPVGWSVEPDPADAADRVLRYGIPGGRYTQDVSYSVARTPPFDLLQAKQPELRFRHSFQFDDDLPGTSRTCGSVSQAGGFICSGGSVVATLLDAEGRFVGKLLLRPTGGYPAALNVTPAFQTPFTTIPDASLHPVQGRTPIPNVFSGKSGVPFLAVTPGQLNAARIEYRGIGTPSEVEAAFDLTPLAGVHDEFRYVSIEFHAISVKASTALRDGFGWRIDDLRVTEAVKANDLRLGAIENPTGEKPLGPGIPLAISARVDNNGLFTQEEARVFYRVLNSTGGQVWPERDADNPFLKGIGKTLANPLPGLRDPEAVPSDLVLFSQEHAWTPATEGRYTIEVWTRLERSAACEDGYANEPLSVLWNAVNASTPGAADRGTLASYLLRMESEGKLGTLRANLLDYLEDRLTPHALAALAGEIRCFVDEDLLNDRAAVDVDIRTIRSVRLLPASLHPDEAAVTPSVTGAGEARTIVAVVESQGTVPLDFSPEELQGKLNLTVDVVSLDTGEGEQLTIVPIQRLEPGQRLTVTLSQAWTPDESGEYVVVLNLSIPPGSDESLADNVRRVSHTVFSRLLPLPGEQLATLLSPDSAEWSSSGANRSFEPGKGWSFGGSEGYPADVDSGLEVVRPLNLRSVRSGSVILTHRYDFEEGFDGGRVEVSVDGVDWIPLTPRLVTGVRLLRSDGSTYAASFAAPEVGIVVGTEVSFPDGSVGVVSSPEAVNITIPNVLTDPKPFARGELLTILGPITDLVYPATISSASPLVTDPDRPAGAFTGSSGLRTDIFPLESAQGLTARMTLFNDTIDVSHRPETPPFYRQLATGWRAENLTVLPPTGGLVWFSDKVLRNRPGDVVDPVSASNPFLRTEKRLVHDVSLADLAADERVQVRFNEWRSIGMTLRLLETGPIPQTISSVLSFPSGTVELPLRASAVYDDNYKDWRTTVLTLPAGSFPREAGTLEFVHAVENGDPDNSHSLGSGLSAAVQPTLEDTDAISPHQGWYLDDIFVEAVSPAGEVRCIFPKAVSRPCDPALDSTDATYTDGWRNSYRTFNTENGNFTLASQSAENSDFDVWTAKAQELPGGWDLVDKGNKRVYELQGPGQDSRLIRDLDLRGSVGNLTLTLTHSYKFTRTQIGTDLRVPAGGIGGGRLEVSVDEGATWIPVEPSSGPAYGNLLSATLGSSFHSSLTETGDPERNSARGPGGRAFTCGLSACPAGSGAVTSTFDLSQHAGKKALIAFHGATSTNRLASGDFWEIRAVKVEGDVLAADSLLLRLRAFSDQNVQDKGWDVTDLSVMTVKHAVNTGVSLQPFPALVKEGSTPVEGTVVNRGQRDVTVDAEVKVRVHGPPPFPAALDDEITYTLQNVPLTREESLTLTQVFAPVLLAEGKDRIRFQARGGVSYIVYANVTTRNETGKPHPEELTVGDNNATVVISGDRITSHSELQVRKLVVSPDAVTVGDIARIHVDVENRGVDLLPLEDANVTITGPGVAPIVLPLDQLSPGTLGAATGVFAPGQSRRLTWTWSVPSLPSGVYTATASVKSRLGEALTIHQASKSILLDVDCETNVSLCSVDLLDATMLEGLDAAGLTPQAGGTNSDEVEANDLETWNQWVTYSSRGPTPEPNLENFVWEVNYDLNASAPVSFWLPEFTYPCAPPGSNLPAGPAGGGGGNGACSVAMGTVRSILRSPTIDVSSMQEPVLHYRELYDIPIFERVLLVGVDDAQDPDSAGQATIRERAIVQMRQVKATGELGCSLTQSGCWVTIENGIRGASPGLGSLSFSARSIPLIEGIAPDLWSAGFRHVQIRFVGVLPSGANEFATQNEWRRWMVDDIVVAPYHLEMSRDQAYTLTDNVDKWFKVRVDNKGAFTDTYGLALADAEGEPTRLPPDWRVAFHDADGQAISSLRVDGGESRIFLLRVSIPTQDLASSQAGITPIIFTLLPGSTSLIAKTGEIRITPEVLARPNLIALGMTVNDAALPVNRQRGVEIVVANTGTATARNVGVSVVDTMPPEFGEPARRLTLPGGDPIPSLTVQAGSTAPPITAIWTPKAAGPHTLTLTLDPDRRLDEVTRDDNVIRINVTIPRAQFPDLVVTTEVDDPQPRVGTPVGVKMRIKNIGGQPALGTQLSLQVNVTILLDEEERSQKSAIGPDETRVLNATWVPSFPGLYLLYASAFPRAGVAERVETIHDNVFVTEILVRTEGLTAQAENTSATAREGGTARFPVVIKNRGNSDERARLRLELPEAWNGEVRKDGVVVDELALVAGAQIAVEVVVPVPGRVLAGEYPIRLALDSPLTGQTAGKILTVVVPQHYGLAAQPVLLATPPGQVLLPLRISNLGNGVDTVFAGAESLPSGWSVDGRFAIAAYAEEERSVALDVPGVTAAGRYEFTLLLRTTGGAAVRAPVLLDIQDLLAVRVQPLLGEIPTTYGRGAAARFAVENVGNVETRLSLDADAPEELAPELARRTLQLAPGEKAIATVDVVMPPEPGPERSFPIRLDAVAGAATFSGEAVLVAKPADLEVIESGVAPRSPGAGSDVSVGVSVRNGGGLALEDVAVALYVDDALVNITTLPTLNASEERRVTLGWRATPGRHLLFAVVDPGRSVAETDEENNAALHSVEVAGPGGIPGAKLPGPEVGWLIAIALIGALVRGRKRR